MDEKVIFLAIICSCFILSERGRNVIADEPALQILFTAVFAAGAFAIVFLFIKIKKLKGLFSILIYIAVFFCTIGTSVYFFVLRRPMVFKPFESHLSEYLSFSAHQEKSTDSGHISGKVITVDKVNRKFDDLYFSLPHNLRASTPDEVGTIVLIECTESIAGTYEDGKNGHSTNCAVRIIDKSKKVVFPESEFYGEEPPKTKSIHGDWYGARPLKEIVKFITALPRQ
jgi:hypothetical protein